MMNLIQSLEKYLPFFPSLNEEQKERLMQNTVKVIYRQGEQVYSPSNECVGVLLILKGTIRTYLMSDEGKEVTLYRLSEGDVCILSASCILKSITFDVYIDAQTDCEFLLINSSTFSTLSMQNIQVENFSLKTTTELFSEVMWAFQQILFMSFDKRLAIFLLEESKKCNNDIIHLTHEEIAKNVGSAREVVSRMLKYFSKEGLVEVNRGGIKILDRVRLRKIVN